VSGERATVSVAAPRAVPAEVASVIVARDVVKGYGRRAVLRGVNLHVRAGRTLAVVGPNGAGKTTLLRVLASLARPSSGTVQVCGFDTVDDPIAVRRRIGAVFGATFLYGELSGAENLRHYARLYGVTDLERRLPDLAALIGLTGRLDDRVSTYSRGMAQRLSIARALLHRPDVLLLDEPDAGLDPATTAHLPRLLRADGGAERAIVLTCHDLGLALDLADDVAILADGRFTFAAPTASLTLETFRRAYGAIASEAANAGIG
jgi:heme exporter protein A